MEKTIGIVYAPIEIENPGQLETLGITWEDVVPIKVGKKFVNVYLVPADREVCEFMMKDLQTKYRNERRAQRCEVTGKNGKLIRCPECNSCESCPFQAASGVRQPVFTSLDELMENGWDCESRDGDPQQAAEIREMIEEIGRKNPQTLRVMNLYLEGYTILEIAEILDLPGSTVHWHLDRARAIVRRYREGR